MNFYDDDYIVVGTGLAGGVLSRKLAEEGNEPYYLV